MLDILILEDDLPIGALLVEALTDAGYRVAHGINGVAGLALMSSCQPRLVLTDVLMPEMDGITFARQLRSRSDLPQPPIIFMTASDTILPRTERSLVWLHKPFDLDYLVAKVNTVLPSRGVARPKRFAVHI